MKTHWFIPILVRRRWEIRKRSWREGHNTSVLISSFRGQGVIIDTEAVWKIRYIVPPAIEALVDASECFKIVGYFPKSGDQGIPEDESNYSALLRLT